MIAERHTPYGPILIPMSLPCASGEREVTVQSPAAWLWQLAKESTAFAECLRRAHAREPSGPDTPWKLILYFDEVSPQNPLARGKDKRKTQNVYWTFAEFDQLYSEDMWFVAACARSVLVEDMPGGMSRFLGMLMKLFFNPEGNDMAKAGVSLSMGDGAPLRIFAEHSQTIADVKAICQVLGCRFGTLPCPFCRNVVDHSSLLHLHGEGRLLPLTSLATAEWKRHTDASVRAVVRKLAEKFGELGPTKFTEYQQLRGWTYNPHSILVDADLQYKAISTLNYDWMHVWCVDGCFARELRQLMDCIHQANVRNTFVRYADLHDYMQPWRWPNNTPGAKNVFETGGFQASASECLSCAQVLRKYFCDVVAPAPGGAKFADAVRSFALACDVLDILSVAVRQGSPEDLERATMEWMTAHLAAHGEATWAFKHHQAGHLAELWAKFVKLLNCWALERKHKVQKKACTDHYNTEFYEGAVMQEVSLDAFHVWRSRRFGAGLFDPRPGNAQYQRILRELAPTAVEILVDDVYLSRTGARFCKGDVAIVAPAHGNVLAEVWFHCSFDGDDKSCVAFFSQLAFDRARRYGRYSVSDAPVLIPSQDLREALIFKVRGSIATVIFPKHCC